MTRYILHGGESSVANLQNKKFFESFFVGLSANVKVLLNYFSQPQAKWEFKSREDKEIINKVVEESGIKVDYKVSNKKDFTKQLKWCDVVYFRGGKNKMLISNVAKHSNFKELIDGKIVAGSSAGAYMLSKYYYSGETNKIEEGLGLLGIKVLCHYGDTRKQGVEALRKHKEPLPLVLLPEYKFFVYNDPVI